MSVIIVFHLIKTQSEDKLAQVYALHSTPASLIGLSIHNAIFVYLFQQELFFGPYDIWQ